MRPLHDVTVVEAYTPDCPLPLRLAGGLAGRIAADLGARVVKLESPEGDPVRRIPPLSAGASTIFNFLNAGKEIIFGDTAALRQRLATADVVILDRGLHRVLNDLPPVRAVLSVVKAEAQSGPESEFTIMARGGLLDIVGDPEREPLKLGGHQAAYAAGLSAFTGIAGALCRPRVAGKIPAETVDVNLLDTVVWLNWKSIPSPRSQSVPPTRTGAAAEWQVLRCADGFIALVYQESDWPALCDITTDARLREARFADRAGRLAHAREVIALIEENFMRMSRRALHALALKHRLPIGPVWSPQELLNDPQNTSRHFMVPTQHDGDGRVLLPRLPVLWSGEVFAPGRICAGNENEARVEKAFSS